MKRRQFVITGAAGLLAAPKLFAADEAASQTVATHDFDAVREIARHQATRVDNPVKMSLGGPFANLNYDQYRGIRFRQDHDPLADTSGFSIDLLPPGLIYEQPVDIYLVRNGVAESIAFDPNAFEFQPNLFADRSLDLAEDARQQMNWSGFRIRYPINTPDVSDEIAVFQGASYFRAIARDTLYGLSARGLAIKTGNPKGEEFPRFTRFWIHQPAPGARTIRIEALLESDSLSGAYSFDITPGAETVFVVNCSLFPRRVIEDYGIAPLTSMYYFSPAQRAQINDYREAVHDSEGIAMLTGRDVRLWRPLSNPPRLQFSAFQDNNPKGFGLIQRSRNFADYEDGEARYEDRPSAWVVPRGEWGTGNVSLIEIPVNDEFNDNIVSFWKPDTKLEAGEQKDFTYDLIWSAAGPSFSRRARIVSTRSGRSVNDPANITFTIDFAPITRQQFLDPDKIRLDVNASQGEIISSHLTSLPDSGLLRASFDFRPGDAKLAELQLSLHESDQQIAENWLYRWIAK